MKSSWGFTILLAFICIPLILLAWNDIELLKATSIILACMLIAAMCKANYIKDKYDVLLGADE